MKHQKNSRSSISSALFNPNKDLLVILISKNLWELWQQNTWFNCKQWIYYGVAIKCLGACNQIPKQFLESDAQIYIKSFYNCRDIIYTWLRTIVCTYMYLSVSKANQLPNRSLVQVCIHLINKTSKLFRPLQIIWT